MKMWVSAVVLAAMAGLVAVPAAFAAGLSWPGSQVLPSFSQPASDLDIMDVTTEYAYQAEGSQVSHGTGHIDGNGWLCQTGVDTPNAHMVYGPYATDIPAGQNTAFYNISIDNNTANNDVMVTVDVRDNTTGSTLASRDITRQEWKGTYAYQRFELPYNNSVAGHALEFRVYWYGRAYIKVDSVGTVPKSKLDDALLFTTLKGLVNKTTPRIDSYDDAVRGAEGKYGWLNALGIGYSDVTDNWTLLTKYRSEISGIVVYDDALTDTVNLATTIASLDGGIVASPAQVDRLTSDPYNLPILNDLRGMFTSKTQVYQYLYDNYWSRVTHKLLIGLNPDLRGFLRDYATAVGTAVVWLDPRVSAEDTILRQFLSGMPSGGGIYMGWWPDEGTGVARASEYGLSTIASDFASNLTVFGGTSRAVNVKPIPNKPPLDNKIYISLILSDGDNLQYLEHKFTSFWNAPNRGQVPMGWTVSPAMLDAMPGVLNHLYDTASPNDALISGPSGIGYTYPNYWGNQSYLDQYVTLSNDYLNRAGLKAVTVWNQINGGINTNVGNSYANNAPSLLGITGQNAGGSITLYNNLLPAQGLNATYCYSTDSMISEINNAIAGWDGTSPRFVSIQTNPWQDANYQSFIDTVNHFSSNPNLVFVRPDTYFQLMRESLNLPVDPASIVATYEAENTSYATSPFSHSVGRSFDNGWTADVADDSPGFMLWGPYVTTFPPGQLTTTYRMKIDSITGNNDNVVTLDVRDNTTGQVLTSFDVYRNQFKANNTYQNFSLTYNNVAGHALEFRAYYKDNAMINIDKVTTTKYISKYEAEGSVLGHSVGRVSGDGWQANASLDSAGHMIYGPYDPNVPVGNRKVTYRLKVDNNSVDNAVVATIDVWDATAGAVVAQSNITRQQFTAADQYQDFNLVFDQTALNHRLEFRVYYQDNSILTVDKVTVN
jgi:hypothetical protein